MQSLAALTPTRKFKLDDILDGIAQRSGYARDRDALYFLAQSLRGRLGKELPERKEAAGEEQRKLAHNAKAHIRDLAAVSLEIAQTAVASEQGNELPAWFLMEVFRDLPRLTAQKNPVESKRK